jgi:hypothetical protein
MTENIQEAINAWALRTLKIKNKPFSLDQPPATNIEFEFDAPITARPEQIATARAYVADYLNNTLLKTLTVSAKPEFQTMELLPKHVLCYIDGMMAFFTNCPLDKQWGDDWDDAPYAYNAGKPYEWSPDYLDKHGIPEYTIIKLMFDTDELQTPEPYSVDAINRGDIPWLSAHRWSSADHKPIHAGVTVDEFKLLIWAAGGDIYERVEPTKK